MIGCLYTDNQERCKICDHFLLDEKTGVCNTAVKCSIANCLSCSYTDDGLFMCGMCSEGYHLSTNTFTGEFSCVETTHNNEGCAELINNKCKKCSYGYYFDFRFENEVKCVRNGELYIAKYKPTTYSCVYGNDLFCTSCGINGCDECYISYPNEYGLCTTPEIFIYACEVYSGSKECKRCFKGYYLHENKCKKSESSFCMYSIDEKKCDQCQGYLLGLDGICHSNDPKYECEDINCLSCIENNLDVHNSSQSCQLCKDGFVLEIETNNCIKMVYATIGCITSFGESCTRCLPMHFIDPSKKNNTVGCTYTNIYNYTEQNNFKGSIVDYTNYHKFCAFYYLNGGCRGCWESVVNSIFGCSPAHVFIEKCVKYSDNHTCSKCADYFYLAQNNCLPITLDKCVSQRDSTHCELCKNELPNEMGECDSSLVPTIPNCSISQKLPNPDEICYECDPGFLITQTYDIFKKLVFVCAPDKVENQYCGRLHYNKCLHCKYGSYMINWDENPKCREQHVYKVQQKKILNLIINATLGISIILILQVMI